MMSPEGNRRVHGAEPQLVEREPIKRERLIVAAVLLIAMASLWIRVLWKKSTTSKATAGEPSGVVMPTESGLTERLTYKPLPMVAGRHDCLAVDVFSPANWRAMGQGATQTPSAAAQPDTRRQQIHEVLGSLGVEGIMAEGERLEAMVECNGRYHLVTEGSTFEVRYQGLSYTLRVVAIAPSKIVVAWENLQSEIRIPGPASGDEL